MFSTICSVAVMSDYFVADSSTSRFAHVVWFWETTKFFQTLLPEQTVKAKSKNCATKRKLSAFLSYLILKIKSVFSFQGNFARCYFCYASNNSSWFARLELTANESGSIAERIKTSRVWHLISNITTFNRTNVTTTMHNFLISGRNSFRYHAVHCCCRWSDYC